MAFTEVGRRGQGKSEWSQQQLAEYLSQRWGKEVSREWVTKRLLFGRFLAFFGTSGTKDGAPAAHFSIPRNLTERRFRSYWTHESPSLPNVQ